MRQTEFLLRAIDQGQGRTEADLVLKGGRFLDLVTGDLVASDIAICGDRIVGTFGTYRGQREVDIAGKIVVPGFIDTHFHVESSLMPPQEFERCVLPHGVTTGICDPHEMANVLGIDAFAWFLASAETLAMDLRVQLSSCVPATDHLETSGARIGAADLLPFASHPKVIGLAEFMNFPGVLAGDSGVLEKLAAFQGRHIDGHAPLLRGERLNGYIAAGIRTEHEATTPEEALEKLSKGMTVLIREGSVCKDLHALAPILTERTAPFLAFCTDDRNPLDIAEEGHLDFIIRTAIALGAPPLAAYRAASWSAARAFGLHDRGLVAPGQRADLVVLDDLETCAVSRVFAAGRPVEEALFAGRPSVAPIGRNSVRARTVTAADFAAPGSGPSTPVIGVIPGQIITLRHDLSLPYAGGERQVDLAQDVIKVAVVERHGRTAPGARGIGVAFVKGFGLQRGAIASSVGHDSHNITVVGVDEADMAVAVNRLGEIEGGFVVVEGGRVLAEIALPLAGLMSLMPFDVIRKDLLALRAAAQSLGVVLPEPFLQVAFLPLPVIPHLKITDRGLVDVDRFCLIDP
ncbi:adenine deaminase [Methylobacterium sp. E-065]|uniref:adenine deaminase n=1 Tax=Methylobacterium sp. E-065 TaxID=2836583 RepID=UPI001FBBC992|nr:adenine deaminase [Methylobacterium sp. E-065]MCJ2017973.1 adenine deaminase [Methylobacterium sp. E-065]